MRRWQSLLQFRGTTAVSSSGNMLSLGTKTSKQAELKVMGTGNKNSVSGQ